VTTSSSSSQHIIISQWFVDKLVPFPEEIGQHENQVFFIGDQNDMVDCETDDMVDEICLLSPCCWLIC